MTGDLFSAGWIAAAATFASGWLAGRATGHRGAVLHCHLMQPAPPAAGKTPTATIADVRAAPDARGAAAKPPRRRPHREDR